MDADLRQIKIEASDVDTESIKQTTLRYLKSQYGLSPTQMEGRFYAEILRRSGRGEMPPSEADIQAIKAMALDYIEGWYEGDVARVERSVHPDLARRVVLTDPVHDVDHLDQISALGLIQLTRCCFSHIPEEQRQKDVTILDVFGNAASLRIETAEWVDYVHAAKFRGRWVIINMLWELK